MSKLIIDKFGLLEKLKNNQNEFSTLEFGCGDRKTDNQFIGIDLVDNECVDIVGDVFVVLSEIENSSVDRIFASHFIEHVQNLELLLVEFSRVLKPNGNIVLTVPHFSNPFFYSDPTHKSFFGLYSMSYFAIDDILSRKVPSYARVNSLLLESVNLTFRSFRPRYLRHLFLVFFGYLFNLNSWTKELYEEIFTKFIPCYEVTYILKKLKI
jgi:SAM-dependent methyltransferase